MAFPGWFRKAKCVDSPNPDRYFPTKKTPYIEIIITKEECHTCPIESKCRTYALVNDLVGIWGGTDENERRDLLAAYLEYKREAS